MARGSKLPRQFSQERFRGTFGAPTVGGAAWHLTSFGDGDALARKFGNWGHSALFEPDRKRGWARNG